MQTRLHNRLRPALTERSKGIIVDLISYLFILLFLYAAANKLLEYDKFKAQLGQSVMLTAFSNQLAWLIPTLEIAISILLIVPRANLLGLYASFTLMFMFTAYIALMLRFADHISCSCGGILEKMGWAEHLIFNAVFVLLGIVGIVYKSKTVIKVSSGTSKDIHCAT